MVVYIYNGKEYRIPIYNMILILPGPKSCILLTYFQGQVAGSHSKCVTEFLVATAGNGARIYPFFRTLPNSFHLNNNTSRSTLLLCRHEKKLINCINLKPVQKKKKCPPNNELTSLWGDVVRLSNQHRRWERQKEKHRYYDNPHGSLIGIHFDWRRHQFIIQTLLKYTHIFTSKRQCPILLSFLFLFFPFKSIKKWSICGVCYYLVHIFYRLNFLKPQPNSAISWS